MTTAAAPLAQPATTPVPAAGALVRRHRLSTRLWHWLNAFTLAIMLMSGLMIFNAHPRLYWGRFGANNDAAWLEIGSGGQGAVGWLRIGSWIFNTTGLLGASRAADGTAREVAFPGWMTIPSSYDLADARLWHLAFALVLVFALLAYLLWSAVNRHISRDLLPTRGELAPAHIWADIRDHARLRFPTGAAALRYNILQKLAYGAVLFVLLPLIIATGTVMAPGMDAGAHWLVELCGGRQSARSLHFLAAWGLVGFFVVHIIMVVLAGPVNELRSMITGWYRLPGEPAPAAAPPAPSGESQP